MTGGRSENSFRNVTVILPVINETYSLEQTVETIEASCLKADICEYLIVVCQRTTPESLHVCDALALRLGGKCRIHFQKLPYIGGAMRDAFDLASGSHTIMMSTDLETDPAIVKEFIRLSKERPGAIITASRWIKGGGFEGYNPLKLVANYLFQKIFSLLFRTRLTDLTYAYRIFPTPLLKAIAWEELKHPFFLETVIKPLKLGIKVYEIPTLWKARTEGESQNPFLNNFLYFRIAFRVWLSSRRKILRTGAEYPL